FLFFFFSSRRRHTRFSRDWSSDVCSSDLSPRQLGPWIRRQYGCAAFSISRRKSLLTPAVMTMAARVPFSPSSLITLGTVDGGVRSEERRVGKESRRRRGEKQIENNKKNIY